MATIDEAFSIALAHHQAGRLPQAEQIYRQILDVAPQHADCRHLLGLIAHQLGRSDQATQLLREAIALNPNCELYHLNLGNVWIDTGDIPAAIACFAEALRLKPDYVEALLGLAIAYRKRGQWDESVACCRRSLELIPDHAESYVNLGIAFQEQGRFDDARAQFEQALRLRPAHAGAHFNLGNVQRLAGRAAEAVGSCQEAVRLAPDWPAAYSNLGAALEADRRLDEAIAAFERAIELDPANVEALNNLAVTLRTCERLDESAEICRRALELKPDFAPAWINLGDARKSQNRLDDAIEAYRRAIVLQPRVAGNYSRLAEAQRLTGRFDEALATCRKAVEFEPGNADAHAQRGAICLDLKNFDEAVASNRKVVRLLPNSAEAHRNLASALRYQGKLDEAIASCRRALELLPTHAAAYNTLGIALQGQQRYAEAQAQFEQALRIQPDFPDARFNKALGHLAQGDLRAGWPDYEYRWQTKSTLSKPKFAAPIWDGATLPGKTILLCGEQGQGDMLQFVRYAPLVKRRLGTVLLHCDPPLAELLATCPGIDRVYVPGDAVPRFDCHVPLLSLPGIFQTDLESIPVDVPYLAPPEELVRRSAETLLPGEELRVGIVWQGGPLDPSRWIPLQEFARLAAIRGVRLYSLQFGAGREQLQSFSAADRVIDLADRIATFQDTACIMRNLDLVISCDSAPAHLAGALGVPVWTALPFTPDWRWLLEREDSPWYPTMRLFRQPRPGDWQGVLTAMAAELEKLASGQACLPRALEMKPYSADSHCARGHAFCRQGRWDEAIGSFRRAIEIEPRRVQAHWDLAAALRSAQRHDEARRVYLQALEIEPENAAFWSQLGTTWFKLHNSAEAEKCFRQALRLAPDVAESHRSLAVALRSLGQLDEAIACCQRALELQPDLAPAYNTLGFCLYDQGQPIAALDKFHECLRRQPDNVNAHNNLAVVQRELGQFAAAMASLDAALAIDPQDTTAHYNRAMFRLQAGDFARAWPEYEWRSRCRKTPGDDLPQPRWNGEDFSGRVLLLYTEQGLGDALQFVRYAPLVKQRGGTVLLECHRPLARLLASCPGLDIVVPCGDPLPAFDLRFPLMSLPGLFGTELESIPAVVPYVAAPDEAITRWRQELAGAPGFKVGIAWQGSRLHPDDRRRSIPLEMFAPLTTIAGVQLYSLQLGAGREQLPGFSASDRLIDLADRIQNFQDTAAIMRNLDLVIACDTALAHLAGALAVPVWTALPFTPDWRWLLEREDSPWYPTMRLFRQQRAGDWPGVFAAIAEALKKSASSRW